MVLAHPSDVRNVGVSIRAAGNHGLAGIRIVSEAPFDEGDLMSFSAYTAASVVVTHHATLDEALADCGQVIGTSRRLRDPKAPPFWPASGLKARLAPEGPIALLFGNERAGLSREEIDRCQAIVAVPTTEACPSLNLSHAVACLGYELARPDPEAVGPPVGQVEAPRAAAAHRRAFYDKVERISGLLSYPPGRNPQAFSRRLRGILDRANPSAVDYGLLSGIFSEMLRLGRLAGGGGAAPMRDDQADAPPRKP